MSRYTLLLVLHLTVAGCQCLCIQRNVIFKRQIFDLIHGTGDVESKNASKASLKMWYISHWKELMSRSCLSKEQVLSLLFHFWMVSSLYATYTTMSWKYRTEWQLLYVKVKDTPHSCNILTLWNVPQSSKILWANITIKHRGTTKNGEA